MEKPIGSLKNFTSNDEALVREFIELIHEYLAIEEVNELRHYYQHLNTSRLQHSINVAYYTFLACRRLNLNVRSATLAALFHDFYLYDWKNNEQPIEGRHSVVHPQVALQNARKYIETDAIMEDCILNHMWPMSPQRPLTKEGWVVQGADKLCAMMELSKQSCRMLSPVPLKRLMLAAITAQY